jgi:hypothetical protein
LGNLNLHEGIISEEGIIPIGAGLHKPLEGWRVSSVEAMSVDVKQKLMKLLVEVSDGAWPF